MSLFYRLYSILFYSIPLLLASPLLFYSTLFSLLFSSSLRCSSLLFSSLFSFPPLLFSSITPLSSLLFSSSPLSSPLLSSSHLSLLLLQDPPSLLESELAALSPGLAAVVHAMLQKSADARPSAAQIAAALPQESSALIKEFLQLQNVPIATELWPKVFPDLNPSDLPPHIYPPQNPNAKMPRAQVTAALDEAQSNKSKRQTLSGVTAELSAIGSTKNSNPLETNNSNNNNGMGERRKSMEDLNGSLKPRKGSESETKKMGKFTVTTTAPPPR